MQKAINGLLVNYEILGKENKQDLVILHGWGRNYQDWLSVAGVLSKDYRVVLIDLPGSGGSTIPENAWDTYDYANFIEEFLNQLKIKSPILIGHSLGGRIGIILGTKNILKKLILVDAAGIAERSWSVKLKIALYKTAKLFLPTKLVLKLRRRVASPDYQTAGKLSETFGKIINQNLRYLLPKINIPTLVIWGEEDDNQTVEASKLAKNLIPDSKVRIVWEAGHNPHLEKPKEFLKILDEELK